MLPINDYYFPLQTGGSSKEEQEKSITITSNGVNKVTPDAGKSLSKVSITTNVPQSGVPEQGVIFSDYDSSGYPHTATIKNIYTQLVSSILGAAVIINMTDAILANFCVDNTNSNYFKNIETINISITSKLGQDQFCFYAKNMFINLYNLKTINFIDQTFTTVIYSGERLFKNTGFTELSLNNIALDGTSSGMFESCKQLTTVNCTGLITTSATSVNYSKILPSSIFSSCSKLSSINLEVTDIVEIKGSAFRGCVALTQINLPSSLTKIGNSAFCNSGLTSIVIPESVTEIGEYIFMECKSLTTVTLPNNMTLIPYYIFGECTALTNITIPESVTEINGYAFYNCTSLTTLTIPAAVTEIGDYALQIGSTDNKATITFKSTTPPTIPYPSVFKTSTLNKIYVPSASVEAYKTADNWTYLAAYIEADPNE